MHTVTFSEDITYHPSHSRRTVQAQHGGGRITKPPVPRNGYLRHHYARDTYLRERSLSEPRHIKLRSKSHTPVPGLRPEVQTLWTNQSNNVQQRHHQRRLYGINEEGSLDEELGHREPTPRGFSASYDAAGMLAGPFYPEAKEEEEEDWSSLFVRNSLRDDDANFTVPAVLPDGRHVTLTGEVGMRIKDLVSAASMEYKLPECRIKLALTKAHLNEDAEARLVEGHQIQFEERLNSSLSAKDDRTSLLSDFLASEEDYLECLQSYFLTYEEPLSQLLSLSPSDKRLLFVPLKPFLKCSKRLIAQIGSTLKSTHLENLRIGNCFPPQFWQEYRKYYRTYKDIRELLHNLRQTNNEFMEHCKELRGAARQSLDSLLLLPVQRVGQYDSFLTNLLDHTSNTHPDHRNIVSASSMVNKMMKEQQEEVSQAENDARLLQVQERFPGDELHLFDADCFKSQKFKTLAARRKSAPSTVLKNALSSSKSKSTAEKSSQGSAASTPSSDVSSFALEDTPFSNRSGTPDSGIEQTRKLQPPTSLTTTKRLYIMEGPVQITVGLQTQVRYLFLFNDVLIIAKPNKSCTLFRLKHRLRVCELWLATCIQDVSELNSAPDTSFVLGWPTTNNVLTFSSKEEKALWWQLLSSHIETEREKQDVKSASIIVCNRDEESKTMHNKTFQVEYSQTSKDVLEMAMQNFNLPQDQTEGYQLWVQSGKEEDLYPLIGHEYPHSIKMNHTRDAALHREDMYFPGDNDQLSSAENELRGYQCQFILRRKGQSNSGISLDTAGIQRKMRKNKKSPFKINFRRSLSGKGSATSPSEWQLFGKSLSVICHEGEPPQPILDLLSNIYNNGPFTHGIFRKSANARVTRELKAQLNAGEECDLSDISVCTAASMLMDFLRNLPDCIFTGQLYSQWILVNQLTDTSEKIDKVKSILSQLPEANMNLLRYIFCIFHHITLNSSENDMTHTNLAICTSPSMIWPPQSTGALAQAMSTKESPQLVQFLIDHCLEIFGEDLATLFGPAPIRKETVCAVDSGGDSDGAFSKRNGSSMDSIEQEFCDDMEQNNNAHHKKWGGYGVQKPLVSPSSLSRDSGITSSDNQIYPDSDNTDTTDSGVNSQERLNTILNSSANMQSRFNHNDGYLTSDGVVLGPTRRARTGSDPSAVSPDVGMRLKSSQTGGSGGKISPETLKLIQDVSKASNSTLLLSAQPQRLPPEDLSPTGYHPSGRLRTSALSPTSNSKSSSLEQMPQVSSPAIDPTKANHIYSRRVSAPTVPTAAADHSFSNRLSACRQSASSVSSSSSDRLSDGHSSGSTEKLYVGQSHMQRTDGTAKKASDVTYYLPASELSSKLHTHPHSKSMSPRGSKVASRSPSFMKALTPENRHQGHHHRPGASKVHRLYHHHQPGKGRPPHVDIPEAMPPSEFFPRDAMRYSLPSQDVADKGTSMNTIEENSENQEAQRTTERAFSPRTEANLHGSPALPTYREAVNRRTQFQKKSYSMEADYTLRDPSDGHSENVDPKRLSAPERVNMERQRSKVKDRRQVVGIFIHDSESSEDEISDLENLRLQRSLSGSVTGHSKARQVRRSSSDSKASSRRTSSSSEKSKQYMQTSQLFYGQDSVFQEAHLTDRSTPTNSTSGSDRTVTSTDRIVSVTESGSRQRHGRRSPEKATNQANHVSSPHRGAAHPASHDGSHHQQPGHSSMSLPRETAKQNLNPINGLQRGLDRDPLSEKIRSKWQNSKKGDSIDSGMAGDEFANMDFDDEAYV